ncbi:mechanosensitive ion channel domain-containing protein [Inquilinus sp. CAU 1745]|uniref:mechanosensitive ion channel family protein n=1 Tax=Inquilinus sp. CAU 1745 TaxID=3140369 RepID=UPI00325BB863
MDVMDAPQELGALATMIWAWTVAFLPRLVTALLILIIGFIVAGWAGRAVKRMISRSKRVDDTLKPLVGTVIRYGIIALVLVAALGQLGVQTASLLAVLGAAGLAIGLALQGTLTNIAAGIMLLWLRPFRTGDYIEVDGGVSGTVTDIGLFTCELKTWDGVFAFAPNSEIWNKALKNHSRNATRLMSIAIGISYDADPEKARGLLLAMADRDERIMKDPAPIVFVDSYGDSAVNIAFRAWAPNDVYWDAQRAMIEQAKHDLEAAGIELPFPQRIVHMLPPPDEKPAPKKAAAKSAAASNGT